eukprot:TRINITY_DN809_c1_g2_i1.p1 TRINITY_DN809_c1_g2~~TRINITY_DN809_c1_g2_i1.p1  ORF type:complete len:684 (+),score=196.74 TRINITY_DN809_c1_g2_i1:232-2283(+)
MQMEAAQVEVKVAQEGGVQGSGAEVENGGVAVGGDAGDSGNQENVHHNSSLYVGDLDKDVTEGQLFEIFSQAGPVHSIRVCRDALTRRSLGYAYVNYNNSLDPQAAQRALETLNYTEVNSRPMRIMWSHRDPSYRKSGVGNIFIKNLDKSIDHKALHDTFSAFGNILSCKVAVDSSGNSKGYGFVHFEKDESAQLAIDKVNNMKLREKIVYVGPFLRRNDRPGDKDKKFSNIFVKNLPTSLDDDAFLKMFEPYGKITSSAVMKDEDGRSKGFGFVNYEEPEYAAKAVEDLHEKEIEGHKIYVARAQKKGERELLLRRKFEEARQERVAKFQGLNLYIKNLSDEIDDEQLHKEFVGFGTITSAKVMRDEKDNSRGFGFVCFSTSEEAARAVSEMSGKILLGKPLYVALAQRKDVRRAQLEQQFKQRMGSGSGSGGPAGGPGGAPIPTMFPPGGPSPIFYPGPRGGGGGRMGGPQGGGMMGGYPNDPRMMPRMPGGGGGGMGRGGPGMMQGGQNMMMNNNWGGNRGRGGRMGRGGGGGGGRGARGGMGGGRGMNMGGGRGGYMMDNRMGPPPGPQPPMPQVQQPLPHMNMGGAPVDAGMQLTSSMLASAPPEQQKQMLGERLFPLVSTLQPGLAGKITGMLLEMDNSELLILLESPEQLRSKVAEAIDVLKQHNAIPDSIEVKEM